MVERTEFADPGHAGLDISVNGIGCNMSLGSFDMSELTVDDAGALSFTIAFANHCDGESTPIQGCLHIERLPPTP
jgi:hypothetical protein